MVLGRDAVVIQQLLGLTCVFAGDQVDSLEHAQGAQRDVLEIADRSGDQVERARGRAASLRRESDARHGGKNNMRSDRSSVSCSLQ